MWCYLHLDAVKEGTCVNSVNQRQHSLSLFAHQLSPLNYTAISRVNIPKIACWKGKLCKCHFEVRCLNHMNHHQFLCNRSLNVTFKVSHSREGVQSTPLEWEKGEKKTLDREVSKQSLSVDVRLMRTILCARYWPRGTPFCEAEARCGQYVQVMCLKSSWAHLGLFDSWFFHDCTYPWKLRHKDFSQVKRS